MRQLFLGALLLVPLTDIAAQETPPITPGAQVRIKAPPYRDALIGIPWIVGSLVSLQADTLVLQENDSRILTIPLTYIMALEIRTEAPKGWKAVPLTSLHQLVILPIPPSFELGTRMRVTEFSHQIVGVFVSSDTSTLVIHKFRRRKIPWSSITKLEVSQGGGDTKLAGTVVGLSVGGVLGLVAGVAGAAEENGLALMGGGAISGAIIGALAGAVTPPGKPLQGTLRGFALTGILPAGLAAMESFLTPKDKNFHLNPKLVPGIGIGLGFFGGLFGALTGLFTEPEEWIETPLSLQMSILPQGIGYVYTVRF